jgi:hypothetical protein
VVDLRLPVHLGQYYPIGTQRGKLVKIALPVPVTMDVAIYLQPGTSDRKGWAQEKLYQPAKGSQTNTKAAQEAA